MCDVRSKREGVTEPWNVSQVAIIIFLLFFTFFLVFLVLTNLVNLRIRGTSV
jgi:hypothetical protein